MEISIEKTIEIFQGMKKGISPWYPEEYYNFAIDIMRKYQKIEQIKNDSLYDIYMAGVNMTGEYQGCWVRFKDIENIVNEHFSGGLDKNSQKLEKNFGELDCISRAEAEKHLDWLYRLKSEIYIYMPKEWLIPMKNALDAAIEKLNQQPQTFKWCTDCREYDQEKHCCHRWSKVIRDAVEEMKQEQEPILDKIRAEIIKYEGDCRLSVDEYPSCKQCTDSVFETIYGIIDKCKAEVELKESEG